MKTYCTSTHPKSPNKSGLARGRKLHGTKDGKKTICNMKVEKLSSNTEVMHFMSNGKCKVCFKNDK